MADIDLDETQEVIIRDGTTSANELKVNSDGSINVFTGGVGSNVKHFNGTATSTPATITFGVTSVSFLIHNLGPKDLYISFDGGTNYKVININSMLALDARLTSVIIKTSIATTAYEALVIH